jgi:hypothetical protein
LNAQVIRCLPLRPRSLKKRGRAQVISELTTASIDTATALSLGLTENVSAIFTDPSFAAYGNITVLNVTTTSTVVSLPVCVIQCPALESVMDVLLYPSLADAAAYADFCQALLMPEVASCREECLLEEREVLEELDSCCMLGTCGQPAAPPPQGEKESDSNSDSNTSDGDIHPCLECPALDAVRTALEAVDPTPQMLADACDAVRSDEAQECMLSCPQAVLDENMWIEVYVCGHGGGSDSNSDSNSDDNAAREPACITECVALAPISTALKDPAMATPEMYAEACQVQDFGAAGACFALCPPDAQAQVASIENTLTYLCNSKIEDDLDADDDEEEPILPDFDIVELEYEENVYEYEEEDTQFVDSLPPIITLFGGAQVCVASHQSMRHAWLRSVPSPLLPFEVGLECFACAIHRHHACLAMLLPRALPAASNTSIRSTLDERTTTPKGPRG